MWKDPEATHHFKLANLKLYCAYESPGDFCRNVDSDPAYLDGA